MCVCERYDIKICILDEQWKNMIHLSKEHLQINNYFINGNNLTNKNEVKKKKCQILKKKQNL